MVFPMHRDCYELLGEVAKPRKIDNAALYQVFTSQLAPLQGPLYGLNFDYGLPPANQRRSWSNPGRKHAVMSPVDIHDSQATDITGSASRAAHKSNVEDTGPPRNAPTGPATDRGRPPNAPTGAYQNYRTGPYHNQQGPNGNHQMAQQANHHQGPRRNQRNKPQQNVRWGKYAVPKEISDAEWENKFSTEFAWILEFLPSKKGIEGREVDRYLFCKVMHDLGRGRGFEGFTSHCYRDTLRALHNRRRLWNVFSRILHEYQRFSKQGSAPKAKPKPEPKQEANSSPQVSESTATFKGPTSTSDVASSPSVTFPSASIRATSTVMSSTTSASVVSISASAASVSVSAASTSTTVASASTSLVSTPSSKVSKPTLKASTSVPKSTPTVTDFFRRPIKGSKPWPCEPHELRNKSPIGASSMETLTLASRNSDLHNAVSFGVDANMQRFEIHFEDNGRKWSHCIDPRSTAMQCLYFDKSSEMPDKITGCYVTMEKNVPVGLRFGHRSQTITVGKPGEAETAYPPQANGGGSMTGIFCQWSDRDSPNAKLASFGIYFADD